MHTTTTKGDGLPASAPHEPASPPNTASDIKREKTRVNFNLAPGVRKAKSCYICFDPKSSESVFINISDTLSS